MKKTMLMSLLAITLSLGAAFTASAQDSDKVYNFVSLETPPTYPGGMASFYKSLAENIKYPKLALEKKVEGNVYLSFVIEKDGSVNDVKVERSLGSGIDEEAVRVLKASKKWNPGVQNGKPVRVKYNLPMKFKLPK